MRIRNSSSKFKNFKCDYQKRKSKFRFGARCQNNSQLKRFSAICIIIVFFFLITLACCWSNASRSEKNSRRLGALGDVLYLSTNLKFHIKFTNFHQNMLSKNRFRDEKSKSVSKIDSYERVRWRRRVSCFPWFSKFTRNGCCETWCIFFFGVQAEWTLILLLKTIILITICIILESKLKNNYHGFKKHFLERNPIWHCSFCEGQRRACGCTSEEALPNCISHRGATYALHSKWKSTIMKSTWNFITFVNCECLVRWKFDIFSQTRGGRGIRWKQLTPGVVSASALHLSRQLCSCPQF